MPGRVEGRVTLRHFGDYVGACVNAEMGGEGWNDQVRDFWSLLLSYGFCVFIYTGHQQPDEVQTTYIRLSPQIVIFISH